MAYTKTHPIKSTLKNAFDYICNPDKTDGSLLVSSFGCTAKTADIEFAWTRRHAIDKGINLGRHLIQAFHPGETTPEQAHEIGMKLAEEILGGKYEFVLTTHIDRGHIHNHLIFNAVNFDNYHHYRSNKKSYHYIRRVSDRLCKEHGLSVITPGTNKGKHRVEYQAEKIGASYKAKLKAKIDSLIPVSADLEDLLSHLENAGYEIKRGKYISCRAPEQERFTRMKTLGIDYTDEVVANRIAGGTRPSKQPKQDDKRINLLIDIKNNIKAQENAGFAHWAKINNLKQAAKTMNFLTENGISSYAELEERVSNAVRDNEQIRESIKTVESRMSEHNMLMKYVTTYRKLKPIYDRYKKSNDKEKFLRGHETNIILFEAAAKALREMKVDKLPSTQKMELECDNLTIQKDKLYKTYKVTRQQVKEYDTIKQNVESMLSAPEKETLEKVTEKVR